MSAEDPFAAIDRRTFIKVAGTSLLVPTTLASACEEHRPHSDAGSDLPSLALSATRTSATAPAGMVFTANAQGFDVERSFHDLRYAWSFSDEGVFGRIPADLPWERDRNVSYGPVVAHTFEAAGNYSVSCTVTDGVTTVAETISVQLESPDEVFPGASSVCVSLSGDFSGAPAGSYTVTSVEDILNGPIREPLRVLFHRGETFLKDVLFFADLEDVQVGAYGIGANPVLRGGLNFRRCRGEVSVWGLDLLGTYDPSMPETTSRSGNGIVCDSGVHATVHDCRLSGWDIGIYPRGDDLECIVVSDTSVTNWFSYGMFHAGGGATGLAGVSMKQHPDTVRAAGQFEEEAPFHADNAPYRHTKPLGPTCFNLVDLFSNNGWGTTQFVQPCIRWNAGGVETIQSLNLDRVRSEGGYMRIGVSSANARPGPMRVVIDKFHHTTTLSPGTALILSFGGTTVRNGVIVQADVPPESTTGLAALIGLRADDPQPDNAEHPIEVYNCTLVDLRSPENAISPDGGEREFLATMSRAEGEYYFANNLLYAPAAASPEIASLPLDGSSLWQPLYPGRRVAGEAFAPEFANSPATASLFRVQSASPAVGASTGKSAIDDFFGVLRPAPASWGATEPEG